MLAYPGATKPATSELQFVKGEDNAQTVVVPVNSNSDWSGLRQMHCK